MNNTPQNSQKAKLHELITSRLRKLIRDGKLKPGDRLPPERKLAELFQVSRNSVREAIRILEDKQILHCRPGSGTFVADIDGESILEAMTEAFESQRTKLEQILEFRQVLEPGVARLAARRISPAALKTLAEIIRKQEEILFRGEENQREMDLLFHQTLVEATGNRVLSTVLDTIGEKIRETRSDSLQSERRARQSIAAHKRIFAALEAGDSGLAAKEMEHHLLTLRSTLDTLH
ncbi:MAG TPA: FadR/GntR family transcriptional regulator [Desulfomicrobiaceae bacterium]|nr:FadR/GntR family transcriptional regulator [Desulfomicrobiaceae bacterium]